MSSLIVLLGIGVAIGLEVAASPPASTTDPAVSGQLLRPLAFAASMLLLASSVVAVATTRSLAAALGSALLVAVGGWLRAAAMRNLGPMFRTEAGAPELVTTGIHGVMRHPSELGFLAWVLGLFVAAPSVLALILALAQLPLLEVRLRIEESDLARRFGAAWSRYAGTTPRLGF